MKKIKWIRASDKDLEINRSLWLAIAVDLSTMLFFINYKKTRVN